MDSVADLMKKDKKVLQELRKLQTKLEGKLRIVYPAIDMIELMIDDAVPLINLAIATSGANPSTGLPQSVSPSRLMQASTILSHGDFAYNQDPSQPMQIGPPLTLSLYMLFAGHAAVERNGTEIDGDGNMHESTRKSEREMTWKEVLHKAQVKLMRVPLSDSERMSNATNGRQSFTAKVNASNEYAYQLHIVEDLDDDRVHNFEEDAAQPGPFDGVQLAGIREILPIHQISKIFYADTGKILNIGNDGEPNSPVLLLKRDINAKSPTRMMEEDEIRDDTYEETSNLFASQSLSDEDDEDQDGIDQQLRRESSVLPETPVKEEFSEAWRLPPDLDHEWLAFEVYNEDEDPDSEDEEESIPSSSGDSSPLRSEQLEEPLSPNEDILNKNLKELHLESESPTPFQSPAPTPYTQLIRTPAARNPDSSLLEHSAPPTPHIPLPTRSDPYGTIRTSLSLLEMLIRLTSLQQFQQSSHLSIPDQTLNFFLTDASTTSGLSTEARRAARDEARRKMGFDPYDESPIKHHGEEYQRHGGYASPTRDAYYEDDYVRQTTESPSLPPRTIEARRHQTPDPWLQRAPSSSPARTSRTPESPYRPVKKATRPLVRVKQEGRKMKGTD
ncbi:hypothetical protein M7I_3155 [Glarea lozoyensis 74030]|uniref:Ran-specific GTPase-activating protein 30 n=1 Tax=Glarea lozoyensis (strain ATCC 74030 / MF5533) TaxID=1104152 RepID=H0EKS6_GLAL7|nr:hypothetical protein M7I_3155 [Glarea lozoyensis 74030]